MNTDHSEVKAWGGGGQERGGGANGGKKGGHLQYFKQCKFYKVITLHLKKIKASNKNSF